MQDTGHPNRQNPGRRMRSGYPCTGTIAYISTSTARNKGVLLVRGSGVNILKDTWAEDPRQKLVCLKIIKYKLIIRSECTCVIDRGTHIHKN
jgi:hypothetical protein